MASIFISYRRDDTGGHAGRLCDRLSARFGLVGSVALKADTTSRSAWSGHYTTNNRPPARPLAAL